MEAWQIVIGVIISAITLAIGVYTGFALREKGPVLSTLFPSLNAEGEMDIKSEYRLISVISGLLFLSFLFLSLYIFTLIKVFLVFEFIFLAADIAYALYTAFRVNK